MNDCAIIFIKEFCRNLDSLLLCRVAYLPHPPPGGRARVGEEGGTASF